MPVGVAPCGDDLDGGIDGIGVQLKADLVIAFAGGTVADGVSAFSLGNFDQAFGDERTGNGGTQKVVVFINGFTLQHGEDVITGELFIEVINDALAGTGGDSLGFETVKFLLLTDIGAVADNFGIVGLFDPLHDH